MRYLVDCEPGGDEDVHVTHESHGKNQIALGMTSHLIAACEQAQRTQSSQQVARTQSRWKYGESQLIITRKMKGPLCAVFCPLGPLCATLFLQACPREATSSPRQEKLFFASIYRANTDPPGHKNPAMGFFRGVDQD